MEKLRKTRISEGGTEGRKETRIQYTPLPSKGGDNKIKFEIKIQVQQVGLM